MSAYLLETDSEDELPPGWEEQATIEGEVFYAHHLCKATQWTHPRTGKKKHVSKAMPFGWERNILADGKVVYVNHENKKTTFTDPRLAFAKEVHQHGLKNFRQRFDASTNALQVLHGQDLSGMIAIVTGANQGGIGYEIARSLGRSGCCVILACRDFSKAECTAGKIRSERPNIKCYPMHLDLASLKSVRSFASAFQDQFQRLDMLILNAGIFGHDHEITEDGIELTFQVNYLSHFYLAHLLKDSLKRAPKPKIISVSAESHRFSSLDSNPMCFSSSLVLSNPNPRNFCPTLAYNDSKLCCVMFAFEANRKWSAKDNIKAIAVHPGNMVSSKLCSHWWLYKVLFSIVRPFAKSLQQAAAPAIFAAASPEMDLTGGIYVNNCFPCNPLDIVEDQVARQNLWMTSLRFLAERNHHVACA
jgi:WW domain-containing oxidoreductase